MRITYEEFRGLVKENLAKQLTELDDAQLEEYLDSEDSVDAIKQEYDLSVKQLERGEITEKEFRNGSVSAAAHCLYMLY